MKIKGKMTIVIGVVLFVVIVLAGTAALVSGGSQNKNEDVSNLAPDFESADIISNDPVSLEKYRGKVILVNFWATWCPPCRAEIPDIIELNKEYSDDFITIGISVDQDRSAVPGFVKIMEINYPVIYGDQAMAAAYGGVTAIPTSFVIDKQGRLVEKIVGFRNKSQFEQIIKKYF